MAAWITIHADGGEGFGACGIGADTTLLDVAKPAGIACRMHGGDPASCAGRRRRAGMTGAGPPAPPPTHPAPADPRAPTPGRSARRPVKRVRIVP